ncbi:MAG: aminotransferase class IV [Bacteroidales bacterium]|nr:aminotransferase class IV [Bacteroidales bacterium]
MKNVEIWKFCDLSDSYELKPFKPEKDYQSLNEASHDIPDGVYATFITFNHKEKVLPFSKQLHRITSSAEIILEAPIIINEKYLSAAVSSVIRNYYSADEVKVRVTLDMQVSFGDLYISIEPFIPFTVQEYENGVHTITCDLVREDPEAKGTRHLKNATVLQADFNSHIEEALLLDKNGNIFEGLSSNFFAIINGKIVTSDDNILPGITRGITLEIIEDLGYKIVYNSPNIKNYMNFDEAFITSSSRGVLPVVTIDKKKIKKGKPGIITSKISSVYNSKIKELLIDLF